MKRHPASELIHHPYQPPAGFNAPQVPVHKASTVIFDSVAAMRARDWRHKTGYTYGLHGTPTSFTLEERIATLEGANHAQLLPSGLAAVVLVDQALLSSGDELLLPLNAYGPGCEFARRELARWGITHHFYDPMDPASLAALLGPKTRLVWLEAPGSVTMEFPPLRELAALAHSAGATTALDNTWGAGLAFNGFEQGADVVVQALTKFPSGGGDVLMGSVCTRDDALHERIKLTHMRTGAGVAANDCEVILRSLATLPLRYEAQDRTARALAAWLLARPKVARVLHPALPGAPGHEHWRDTCTAAAGLFSVLFDERFGSAQVDAFVEALRLFRIGYSWAGPVSLVVPYDLKQLRPNQGSGPNALRGHLVRFSVGFEEVQALQDDLEQALMRAFA
jgi:cystathionine beta-lyase